ncbi:DUF2905 domain-containing protein [Psychrobacter arenosus]|uniref:DUF2905 domain-containing protein n=1 Tax=Psychrobacter arenosus TaxID=256326 RepID=UPI00191965AC|nr:DUF2905 domain-containing protein [Psychrobacter arenosus]
MAKVLIILGIVLVLIGLIWLVFPSAFCWLGRLPGDISYSSDSGNTRFYFPIVTMIVISIVGSILLNLFSR